MDSRWLPEAIADVDRLYNFLKALDVRAANRALDCIQEAALRLQEHPELGRPMRDDRERREWVAPFGAGAYILRYRLARNTVIVLRVWHSREWRE
jgi:toxin ParE1/3/4